MKLRKTLYINGEQAKLVADEVVLSLYSPGRAVFTVQSATTLSGHVRLHLGYSNQNKDQVYFVGVIRSCREVATGQQRIHCRELTGVLYVHLPMALRHPTMREVLQRYTDETGLLFVVPEQPYSDRRVPAFYSLGDGFYGLDSLGDVFGIDGYIWQQQGDGRVFAGAWADSRWATRPVTLPETQFVEVTAAGAKKCIALPQLRPGILLNGEYLAEVNLKGHHMVLKCESSLRR